MTIYSVNAVLEVHYKDNQQTEMLVNGDLNVTVEGDRIVNSETMEQYASQMKTIVDSKAGNRPHSWALMMAYEGRCWFLEPGETGIEIGYYDIENVEDWCVVNGN